MNHVARLLLVLVLVLEVFSPLASADPLDPKAVPESLKPWIGWVLDGSDTARCPTFFAHGDVSRCAWPARLELTLDEHDGRFVQKWHVEARSWLALPGDTRRWPSKVEVDGAPATVITRSEAPSIQVSPGDHSVTGNFMWDSLPESMHVPPETGLLALTLRGARVPFPNRDAQGTVWLQKAVASEEGDAVEFVVHRKVSDDVPLILDTHVELHVSGRNREEVLGRALPTGFRPLSLDSPVPARLEPDGRLLVQLRPGVFTLDLVARSEGPVSELMRPAPDGAWRVGDEVWVFEAKDAYRVVTVEGAPSIDPQQTTLPDTWKRLPAYAMGLSSKLRLVEKRRGDADPPPNQLSLSRVLWLDFTGSGYTVHDTITGQLNRDSRLTMAPPTELGRVSIGGANQFITRLRDASGTGVEVRGGDLNVAADSRIPGDPNDISAVSWDHDFRIVSGVLHLPPGWRLFHASGVDDVAGTWVRAWSLVELFLALVVAITSGRLYGAKWGIVALVLLVLILPEPDAPKWCWLFPVLATEALFRALPMGKVKKLFAGARFVAVVLVAIVALPFAVREVRQGMYPALAHPSNIAGREANPLGEEAVGLPSSMLGGFGGRSKGEEGAMGNPAAAELPPESTAETLGKRQGKSDRAPSAPSSGNVSKFGHGDLPPSNAQLYDPTAIVQTGPGLPQWNWTTLALRWSGPVSRVQRLHLYLMSPALNFALALARAALLLVLILRMLPCAGRLLPGGWVPAFTAVLLLLAPAAARADLPDKEILTELHDRLLRAPECAPTCASSDRMEIDVRGDVLRARLAVDAAAPTAVPLPGSSGQWTPTEVLLDGQAANALLRLDDGVLWIEISKGAHQLVLEGGLPDRESVELALPLKPHRVGVSAVGWTIEGVHEDGLADDDLQLTRVRAAQGSSGALESGALPPFVRVERTLSVGLDWQVDTHVMRVSPPGTAVVLEVPLLMGESVTTADQRVVGGKVLVNMAPQATEASWHSVLDEKSPLKLTAPRSIAWMEVWRVDVGPVWHATYWGIPAVRTAAQKVARIPEWRPWPGEEVVVDLVRPQGVSGQTLTFDASEVDVRPGLRATDVTLRLLVRSSRGAEVTVTLPPSDAEIESLSIDGATQPVRQEGRKVTVPFMPGSRTILLTWRETPGIAFFFETPSVDLGAPGVNVTTTLTMPGGRWLLLAGGPRVGPAVVFWSFLVVLLAVSLGLGRNQWTPLRWWHWLLLGVGLSQVSVFAAASFVGWLLVLGWRGRKTDHDSSRSLFNLRQIVLATWTVGALCILAVSLYQGLLGAPEMQVSGNGSTAEVLRWFADRSGAKAPSAWVISVPILFYRCATLAWALWVASALLRWLRWGWSAFSSGGRWKKRLPVPSAGAGGAPPEGGLAV